LNEPLEKLEMGEGKELIVTIKEKIIRPKDAFERSAGKWKGTIDAEALIENE
jgi:predicted DNA-binding antitoxin AbrB/MazE fold protein